MNAAQLVEPTEPTMYFIGVTTGQSSIMDVFPRWAEALGIDAVIRGIDLPLHAPAEDYRAVVDFIDNAEHARGALVTTHKLDLFSASRDQFDWVDPLADLMAEVSCISKRGAALRCHAKDPITGGLAVDAIVSKGHWRNRRADALFIGAGGSTIAITWHLMQASRNGAAPQRIHVSNRSQSRLDHIAEVHARIDNDIPVEYHLCPTPGGNDAIVALLAPDSLVVNATGLGKDAPGSPITSQVVFPERAIAWDLNYRGELVFLDTAAEAPSSRQVRVEDGWTYFMHGWLQAIGEVFNVDVSTAGAQFEELCDLAGGAPSR